MNGIIYLITGPGCKTYVGQTITSLNDRWIGHKSDAKAFKNGRKKSGTCSYLYASMSAHGIENYTISVLWSGNVDKITELDEQEAIWILEKKSLYQPDII